MVLGEKILMLRKARGMSQEQLAQALEVSRQAVSKWELNEAVPDVTRVVAMSELFGVTTDYLLKDGAGGCDEAGTAPGAGPESGKKSDQRWLGTVLAAGSALAIFGMWAVEEIRGVSYYTSGGYVGSGLGGYLRFSTWGALLFLGLLVCLAGGIRLLMGKPFWFKLASHEERRARDSKEGGDSLYSKATLRFLQEDPPEQSGDQPDKKE